MRNLLELAHTRFRVPVLIAVLFVISACIYTFAAWVRHIPSSTWLVGAQLSRGPKLELTDCEGLDLGEGAPGEVLVGQFVLTNGGDQPIKFRVESGCGCLSVDPRVGEIESGGKIDLEVAIKLEGRGSARTSVVTVHSNDPKSPERCLRVAARCPAVAEVSPRLLTLGTIPLGVAQERTLSLTRVRKPRDQLVLSVRGEHLRAEWEPGDALQVKVSVRPMASVGYLEGAVEIADLTNPEDRVMIPVTAEISTVLRSAPQSINLSLLAEAQSARILVWKIGGGRLGKLRLVDAPPHVTVCDRSTDGTERRLLEVSQSDKGTVGELGELKLWFDGEAEPLVVRLRP